MPSATTTSGPPTSLARRRAAVAATFFAQGLLFISLTTHLPQVRERFGIGEAMLSLMTFVVVLLAGAGSVLAEQVAARRDSAAALRTGLTAVAIGLAAAGLAPSLVLLCVALAVYGLGLGMVDASGNMQAVTLEHAYGRPVLPSFHGAWTAGGIVATVVALALGHVALAAALVPVGIVPLACLILPLVRRDHGAAATATDLSGVPWRRIVMVGLALVLFYMVDTASQTWGPVFLRTAFDVALGNVAVATLPYLVATLVARLLGDRAVARFGPVPVLRVGGAVAALALAVVVFAPSAAVAVAGFSVLGLGVGVVAPLSFSAAASIAGDLSDSTAGGQDPAARRARVDAVVARFNQFNYVGALLGAVVTGLVGAGSLRVGFALPMVLVLGLLPLARAFAPVRPAPPAS